MEDQYYDLEAIRASIIVCTHNRYGSLGATINSIELQTIGKSQFELIIVDNSSDLAGRAAFLESFNTTCNCLYSVEEQPGLSRARNRGVDLANGEIVCFIDDDAIADEDWVEKIIRYFDSDATLGVLGGEVKPIWPKERPAWLHKWQEGFLTIVERGSEARPLRQGEWLAGTNIAFRRDLVKFAGGFDERLGRSGNLLLSNEEVRLCEKIVAQGYSIWYFPDLLVLHRVHRERIDQSWLRRRVAFQVISELIEEGSSSFDAKEAVGAVLDFADHMPKRSRGVHGLFMDVDDPDVFNKQTTAIAALMRLCLLEASDWRRHAE